MDDFTIYKHENDGETLTRIAHGLSLTQAVTVAVACAAKHELTYSVMNAAALGRTTQGGGEVSYVITPRIARLVEASDLPAPEALREAVA